MKDVVAVIMGGGQGTRLYPLTKLRAKPAVPLAGKYRLIDVPISNCINSQIKRLFVLTQFQSFSLHRHISDTYRFTNFDEGFVYILAAEQTPESVDWFQGTADAVRKNLHHFIMPGMEHVLILSGDQLYRMDFENLMAFHKERDADLTIAVTPVTEQQAPAFGILQLDAENRISAFTEKPKSPERLKPMRSAKEVYKRHKVPVKGRPYLASMGIYVFKKETIYDLLLTHKDKADFGKEIIPAAIDQQDKVYGYVFDGYWEDIGTLRSFFEANLDQTSDDPQFDFFEADYPVFTRNMVLPVSKIVDSTIDHCVFGGGAIVNRAQLEHCVIGVRSIVEEGVKMRNVVMMGADFYERPGESRMVADKKLPPMGIGANSRITDAIIDKNARIGRDVQIANRKKVLEYECPQYTIRDGIVVIPKASIIPDGTKI